MKAKAFWCTVEEARGETGEVLSVSLAIRGRGKTLDHAQLFKNAVTALRKNLRDTGSTKQLEELFLSHIHTEVGQVVRYEVVSNTIAA